MCQAWTAAYSVYARQQVHSSVWNASQEEGPSQVANEAVRRSGCSGPEPAWKKRILPDALPTRSCPPCSPAIHDMLQAAPAPGYSSLFTHLLFIQINKALTRPH